MGILCNKTSAIVFLIAFVLVQNIVLFYLFGGRFILAEFSSFLRKAARSEEEHPPQLPSSSATSSLVFGSPPPSIRNGDQHQKTKREEEIVSSSSTTNSSKEQQRQPKEGGKLFNPEGSDKNNSNTSGASSKSLSPSESSFRAAAGSKASPLKEFTSSSSNKKEAPLNTVELHELSSAYSKINYPKVSSEIAQKCVRENLPLHGCADSWYVRKQIRSHLHPNQEKNLELEYIGRNSTCQNFFTPLLITRNFRAAALDEVSLKYVMEFYGDSNLRNVWERVSKSYYGLIQSAKQRVNQTQRGPYYSTPAYVDTLYRPVTSAPTVPPGGALRRSRRYRPRASTSTKAPLTPEEHAILCETKVIDCQNHLPYHRSFFRFDYLTQDLQDPISRTSQAQVKNIPALYWTPELLEKASERGLSTATPSSNVDKLIAGVMQGRPHSEITNNPFPKMIFFSLGVHYATRVVYTFEDILNKTYNSTNITVVMKIRKEEDAGGGKKGGGAKYPPLPIYDELLMEELTEPLFAYANFLASRKNNFLLVYAENRLDCWTLMNPLIKKGRWMYDNAHRCHAINKVIDMISDVMDILYLDVLTPSGAPRSPNFPFAVPAELLRNESKVKYISNFSSLLKKVSSTEQQALKESALKYVHFRSLNCDRYNNLCSMYNCACTKEGVHLNKKLLMAQTNEILTLMGYVDRCLSQEIAGKKVKDHPSGVVVASTSSNLEIGEAEIATLAGLNCSISHHPGLSFCQRDLHRIQVQKRK